MSVNVSVGIGVCGTLCFLAWGCKLEYQCDVPLGLYFQNLEGREGVLESRRGLLVISSLVFLAFSFLLRHLDHSGEIFGFRGFLVELHPDVMRDRFGGWPINFCLDTKVDKPELKRKHETDET